MFCGYYHYRKRIRCSANTIFINNANNFGLSDLHQMRGRVDEATRRRFVILSVRRIQQ
jgi:transcription-repair coupling factor (superfamily II helicase)